MIHIVCPRWRSAMHRTVGGTLAVLMLAAPTGGGEVTAAEPVTPLERLASTPKGQLKSPYRDFASVAEEGYRKYMAAGCNGCHGGWHGRTFNQSYLDLR